MIKVQLYDIHIIVKRATNINRTILDDIVDDLIYRGREIRIREFGMEENLRTCKK